MKCYGVVLLSLLILNLIQAISISKEPINLLLKPDSNDNKRSTYIKLKISNFQSYTFTYILTY